MWPKSYRDYRKDKECIKYPIETGKAIKGCEMHEFYGWGTSYQQKCESKKGILRRLIDKLRRKKEP